jgi:hypothetical protein
MLAARRHGACGAMFFRSIAGSSRGVWVVVVATTTLQTDKRCVGTWQAAFADTRVPKLSVVEGQGVGDEADFEVDEDPRAATQLPLDGVPVVITLRQVGTQTWEEIISHVFTDVHLAALRVLCECALTARRGGGRWHAAERAELLCGRNERGGVAGAAGVVGSGERQGRGVRRGQGGAQQPGRRHAA